MSDVGWSNSAYESIVRTFGARTGLEFHPHQRDSAEQAIRNAMVQSEIANLSEMVRMVEHDKRVLDCLIVELTVGETYFLREPAQCEFIRGHVLPDVMKRAGPDHRLRIWSAGCASGEEPYSLAMLCTAAGLAAQSTILATDISSLALKKARAATYSQWSLRGAGADLAKSYLRVDGEHYQVDERIRRMVHFEFLNLALDVYPSLVTGTQAMDLILCRNVLIYVNRETTCAVAERLYQCLADGGWLITASGDPPLDDYAPFEPVVTDKGVYYRKPLPIESLDDSGVLVGPHDRLPESRAVTRRTISSTPAVGRLAVRSLSASPQSAPSRQDDANHDPLVAAQSALASGDYRRAVELTADHLDNASACVIHVNALANVDTCLAREKCGQLAERHSLSAELHYLHAVLCLEMNWLSDAIRSAERAVYVDRSLAIVHFLLGSIFQRRGEFATARREFRNAKNVCSGADPDSVLPLADGETARHLAEAADMQLIAIDAALEK